MSIPLLVLPLAAQLAVAAPQTPSGFAPRLLQMRLEASSVPVGGNLGVTYWWQNVGTEPDDDIEVVFVHVRRAGEAEDAPNAVRFGADHEPPIPTPRWRPGRVVRYSNTINLPDRLPPGDYVVLVGLFARGGSRRQLELPLPPGENDRRYLVGRFRIVPAGQKGDDTPVTQTFFPVPPASAVPQPQPPARTLQVGEGPLSLVLDAERPRVVSWRLAGAELPGDLEGEEPEVRLLSMADNRVNLSGTARYAITWTSRREGNRVVYHGTARTGQTACLDLDLCFTVRDRRAEVTLENVREHPGYELVSVSFSRIVAAREGARMAIPNNSGKLVDPANSTPAERLYSLSWHNAILAGVVHDRRMVCALDVPGVDDHLVTTVGEGWAALGASLEYRAPAKPPVPSLRLTEKPTLRLRFAKPQGTPRWMDGARLLREEITARPPKVYDNTAIYKIFCDAPGATSYVTFDEALGMVRRLANLSDRGRQVAYLVGWQHRGHDTGYPDVFTVNERLGGREALLRVMKEAAQYNAVLSFHDNYDDAYEHSTAWDPEMIARDASGALLKGGVWSGGQSYIFSFPKYLGGPAKERVWRTLEMFPIRDSYHIDVLSVVPRRRDYNPNSPAGGDASTAAKIALVREFNKRGVDVTSEGISFPFVGVTGHNWHLIRGKEVQFAGEERIPFVPFILSNRTTWGGTRPTLEDIPEGLLYGGTFSGDFSKNTPIERITDAYYLLARPWMMLRTREMTAYHAANGTRRMEYGPDTFVEVGAGDKHYRVVVDGRPIAVDFTCFAPNTRGDAWLAYSRSAGTLDYPAPAGWTDPKKVSAVTLTPDGPGANVPVRLEGGRIRLDAAAATPYRLTYGR